MTVSRITLISIGLTLLLPLLVSESIAEVVKWVDDTGKVHYSDSNDIRYKSQEDDVQTEVIRIRDKYSVPAVITLEPQKYSGNDVLRALSVSKFGVQFPNATTQNVLVGRIICGRPVDLFWTQGDIDRLSQNGISDIVESVFQKYGYRYHSLSTGVMSSLQLEATLKKLKINVCPSKNHLYTQDAAFVKIKWELFDPITGDLLFKTATNGSFDALRENPQKNGTENSISMAMESAAINLLATPGFAEKLKRTAEYESSVIADESYLKIDITSGRLSGDFRSEVNKLKANSMVIVVDKGHGSGVLLNDDGYILTNAHVVGRQKKVLVEFEHSGVKQTRSATVLRFDAARDVALLQLENVAFLPDGVPLALSEPVQGDEIYVIGAPLEKSLSHTVTKGVVSAKRKMDGLDFFQTDAAINRGNSGGPVFNEKAELVAITVAGLFTNDGASLNINYLIPIESALQSLNVVDENSATALVTTVLNHLAGENAEPISIQGQSPLAKAGDNSWGVRVLQRLDSWLRKPVL